MRPMVSFWDLTGPNRVSEQTSHDVMSDDSIKLLNSRGRISSLTNLQRSRSASLYTKISMSASRNASPSLRRLESVVDDDDGDEVNWSIEHGSTPIWRSGSLWFFVTSQDFKNGAKNLCLPHPCAAWRQIESSQP